MDNKLISGTTSSTAEAVTRNSILLTTREVEVLHTIAHGKSNTEIADFLVISGETVKKHVAHLLAKLGLRDRTQVAVYAYNSGLIRPDIERISWLRES